MKTDPSVAALHYLITQFKVRIAAIKSGELDRGALSLEWVVIAVGLVAAAAVVAAFVSHWVSTNDQKIQSP
jgi:hypothetical protein